MIWKKALFCIVTWPVCLTVLALTVAVVADSIKDLQRGEEEEGNDNPTLSNN
jgi:hypothetical protein